MLIEAFTFLDLVLYCSHLHSYCFIVPDALILNSGPTGPDNWPFLLWSGHPSLPSWVLGRKRQRVWAVIAKATLSGSLSEADWLWELDGLWRPGPSLIIFKSASHWMPSWSSPHFSLELILIWIDEATDLFVISIVIVIMLHLSLLVVSKFLMTWRCWFVYQQFIKCNPLQSALSLPWFT